MKRVRTKPRAAHAGPKGIEIAYELKKRGFSQARLAAQLKLQHASVSNVVHGRATSYRVATSVAEILGRSVDEIWPGRYVFKPRGRRNRRDANAKCKG